MPNLPDELRARVRAHADETGMPIADIVADALTAYFSRMDNRVTASGTGADAPHQRVAHQGEWSMSVHNPRSTPVLDRGQVVGMRRGADASPTATIRLTDSKGNETVITTDHFTIETNTT